MVAIVYTACAQMPSSCRGRYRRVMIRCAYAVALRGAYDLARRIRAAGDVAEAEQLISTGSA